MKQWLEICNFLIFIQVVVFFTQAHPFHSASMEKEPVSPIPVVLWHGMGDFYCSPWSMDVIKEEVIRRVPGIYVHSVEVGDNFFEDYINGFFDNDNSAIIQVCEKLKSISELSGGYHAMGFSQGGQFLRAMVQRCPTPPMRNLITFGGQHQGVFGIPRCDPVKDYCNLTRELATTLLYDQKIQTMSVQAQYWHDPTDPRRYQESNIFLADINNEVELNDNYRKNLKSLWNFVMAMFTEDTMVFPKESEWFGFYDDGDVAKVHILEESSLYIDDRLGLKEMNEQGRLVKYSIKGNHMQFSLDCLAKIIDEFVIGNGTKSTSC